MLESRTEKVIPVSDLKTIGIDAARKSAVLAYSHWQSLILLVIAIICMLFAVFSRYDSPFYVTLSIASLCAMFFINHLKSRKLNQSERIRLIYDTLKEDPRLAERAKDMYLSSEYYRGRATFNSISSILTMIVLLVFVAFAGAILNKDTVKFDAVERYESILENRYLRESPAPDRQEQALRILGNYSETLKKQMEAEAAVNEPVYRVASGLLIRISAVAVAVYLVVILNNSYKYNNNVATIYRARFMALMRGDENFESFAKYSLFLSTETVDYNTKIDHPVNKMLVAFEKIKDIFENKTNKT